MFERFALTSSVDDTAAALAVDSTKATGWRRSYRFGVGDRILVVRSAASLEPPRTQLVVAKWGYLPAWHRGELKPVASVGVERLTRNGVFRNAVVHSRCLIPLNGYFDWRRRPDGTAVPLFVQGPEPVMAAMGLMSVQRVGARDDVCIAFVTRDVTESGEQPQGEQTRTVPALLHPSEWPSWLASDHRQAPIEQFTQPSPLTRCLLQELSAHQVSDRITAASARDSASITAPILADARCR